MMNFVKARGTENFPFGYVEVKFPDKAFDTDAFYSEADRVIADMKAQRETYDRKTVWNENPYYRFFKKFKKTYPVMLQIESVMLKDRPFPQYNPVAEIPFLAEIATGVLSGAHDADCCEGAVTFYLADSKEEFDGMRGETVHTYPGDFCARDEKSIILSEIAGADAKTCVHDTSRHVFYPVFSYPDGDTRTLTARAVKIMEYTKLLSPDAECEFYLL